MTTPRSSAGPATIGGALEHARLMHRAHRIEHLLNVLAGRPRRPPERAAEPASTRLAIDLRHELGGVQERLAVLEDGPGRTPAH